MKKSELREIIKEEIYNINTKPSWLLKTGSTINLKSDEFQGLKGGTYKIKDVILKWGKWLYKLNDGDEVDAEYLHGEGDYKNSEGKIIDNKS
jgi:hypothetical protein